jgi:3-dehydroquinate dehydratase / shikimate dehydrogenase
LILEHVVPIPAYVASLAAGDPLRVEAALRSLPAGANAVEFRMDLADAVPDSSLLRLGSLCTILTYRTRREGGRLAASRDDYRRAVERAYAAGATVDVEIRSGLLSDPGFCPDRTRVIASAHPAPGLAPVREDEALAVAARAVKLVVSGGSLGESLAAAARQRHAAPRLAVIPMGVAAAPGRILSSRFGAPLTYGSLERATGQGQLPLADMLSIYGVADRRPIERLFGIVARDPASTLSPMAQNALWTRRGLPGLYLPLPVDDFSADWSALDAFEPAFQGVSVTIPWKAAAAGVGVPSEEVRAIGVANTLVRNGAARRGARNWKAFNTDVEGVFQPLADFGGGNGRAAVVVGSGGAARAAGLAAARLGYEVTFSSRQPDHARKAAAALGASSVPLSMLPTLVADLWIHATPLGRSDEDPLPIPPEALACRPIVFDCVYRRGPGGAGEETRLVRRARDAGCRVIDGLTMFAHQAARQAALFGIADATAEEILEVLGKRA